MKTLIIWDNIDEMLFFLVPYQDWMAECHGYALGEVGAPDESLEKLFLEVVDKDSRKDWVVELKHDALLKLPEPITKVISSGMAY